MKKIKIAIALFSFCAIATPVVLLSTSCKPKPVPPPDPKPTPHPVEKYIGFDRFVMNRNISSEFDALHVGIDTGTGQEVKRQIKFINNAPGGKKSLMIKVYEPNGTFVFKIIRPGHVEPTFVIDLDGIDFHCTYFKDLSHLEILTTVKGSTTEPALEIPILYNYNHDFVLIENPELTPKKLSENTSLQSFSFFMTTYQYDTEPLVVCNDNINVEFILTYTGVFTQIQRNPNNVELENLSLNQRPEDDLFYTYVDENNNYLDRHYASSLNN
jgi:hypothetical protein